MPRNRDDLVGTGRRYRVEYLVEQAGVTLARAGKEASAVAKFGATKDVLARTGDLVKKIQTAAKDRALSQAEAQSATASQNDAAEGAKDWLRQAILIGTNAYDGEAEIVDEFLKGGKIGTSVPKLLGKVRHTLGLLKKDASVTAKFGATADFLKKGDSLAQSLAAVDVTQEQKREALPQATEAFYADKGNLYYLLKTINRAGRAAHVGEPEAAAAWNLSVLHRRGAASGAKPPGTGA